MENFLDQVNNFLLLLCSQYQTVNPLVPSSPCHPHHKRDPPYQTTIARACFTVTQCPSRLSICSSCHVRVSNCHFCLPKLSISARHQEVRVTAEKTHSQWVIHVYTDSTSKKKKIKKKNSWLSAVWINIFAYTIWLFISNMHIASVTVTVKRTRISSLRGGRQKGGRIQHASEFSEPSKPILGWRNRFEFVRARL